MPFLMGYICLEVIMVKKSLTMLLCSLLCIAQIVAKNPVKGSNVSTQTEKAPTQEQAPSKQKFAKEDVILIRKYLNEEQIQGFLQASPEEQQSLLVEIKKMEAKVEAETQLRIEADKNKPLYQKTIDFGKKTFGKTIKSTKQFIAEIPVQFIQGFAMAIIGGITQYYGKKTLKHFNFYDTELKEARLKSFNKGYLSGKTENVTQEVISILLLSQKKTED